MNSPVSIYYPLANSNTFWCILVHVSCEVHTLPHSTLNLVVYYTVGHVPWVMYYSNSPAGAERACEKGD